MFPFVQTPTFPDNPNARFMSELVAAINSGDPVAMRSFADTRLNDDVLLGLGLANHARRLGKISSGSGGLRIERIDQDGSAVFVRTRQGNRLILLMGGVGPKGKGGYDLRRMPEGTASVREHAWPKGPQARDGVVRAIRGYLDSLAKRDLWNGVVLIAQGDRVLLHTAHGLAERSFGTRIGKGTKFNLASLGKMFTASMIGSLVDEGKLSLDDQLGRFRPDWPDVEARERVTVRMLLNHSAGFGGLFDSPGYDRSRRYVDATDISTALYGEPLTFPPGSAWNYSNGGFVVLGSIIEKITGKPYEMAVRERLFRPLGMNASGWADGNEALPGLATVYDRDVMDPLGLEPKRRDGMFAGWRGGPHGGGYSNAGDLFRFARALRTGRLMKPSTVEEFLTVPPVAKGPNYALGFVKENFEGQTSIGHNGHARADLGIFWDLDLTVIALGNDLSEPVPLTANVIRRFIAQNAAAFKN
ncbi:class A beta-lactamase-related serine hydrolase [bacterium]|nr:MAG: class A beta-lactamase-related serine hydrolase [bacterium]